MKRSTAFLEGFLFCGFFYFGLNPPKTFIGGLGNLRDDVLFVTDLRDLGNFFYFCRVFAQL